jgi:hypothetical protein
LSLTSKIGLHLALVTIMDATGWIIDGHLCVAKLATICHFVIYMLRSFWKASMTLNVKFLWAVMAENFRALENAIEDCKIRSMHGWVEQFECHIN